MPASRNGRRIIRRTQHAAGGAAVLHSRIEIVVDLLLVPNMIAGGEHVGAQFEKFLADRRGDAKAPGRIFDVDNQELDAVGLDKMMKMLAHDLAPRAAEHVADEENPHPSG